MTKVEECLRFGKSMGFEHVWQAVLEYERNYYVFFSIEKLKEEVEEFRGEFESKGLDSEMSIEEGLSKYAKT